METWALPCFPFHIVPREHNQQNLMEQPYYLYGGTTTSPQWPSFFSCLQSPWLKILWFWFVDWIKFQFKITSIKITKPFHKYLGWLWKEVCVATLLDPIGRSKNGTLRDRKAPSKVILLVPPVFIHILIHVCMEMNINIYRKDKC